jgi:hypothetical protein
LNAIHQAGFLPEFINKVGIASNDDKEIENG